MARWWSGLLARGAWGKWSSGLAGPARPQLRAGSSSRAAGEGAHLLYSREHYALRASLRKIIDKEINPFVDKWEEEGQFPAHKVFKTLGQAGFLGVNKPTEYGGMGLDFSYSIAVAEELGNIHCGGVPMAIGVQTDMATPALTRFGSDELKRQFLVPTIAGELVACLGVSELGAGSDVAKNSPRPARLTGINVTFATPTNGDLNLIYSGDNWKILGIRLETTLMYHNPDFLPFPL